MRHWQVTLGAKPRATGRVKDGRSLVKDGEASALSHVTLWNTGVRKKNLTEAKQSQDTWYSMASPTRA